ncbi:MAG: N-acetyltransferase [Prevotellaceae bacterium]|jgi:GNAT superfamily N-acetyltransferase|nr:N-acetyltransferase [Prevotellaceae bacterium]
MSVEIKQVTTRRELKRVIRFANSLYKGNPYYCPPLEYDELDTFNPKKNPTLEFAEYVCFAAYLDGQMAGRIVGLINPIANEAWGYKRVRFGWFDFIDDKTVSRALLDAVAAWGKSRNMNEMNGPLGFSDFDHQGLLIEGYDYNSPMASLYNHPYYVSHYTDFGLVKEMDWIEFRVNTPHEIPGKIKRVAEMILAQNKLKIVKVRSAKELIRRYGYTFFDVIDEAYRPLYNYQPLTPKQKEHYCKMYFPLLNYDFITLIVNEKDEMIGVGVGMPDISDALRRCNGKLFPFGWYHLLRALKAKTINSFDLLLIAVRPDYQNKGVNSLFFYDQVKYFIQYGIQYSETTSILETNFKNQANWSYFERFQHKRRRAYTKPLED